MNFMVLAVLTLQSLDAKEKRLFLARSGGVWQFGGEVKYTLQQVTKAQRGSRGIALLFH